MSVHKILETTKKRDAAGNVRITHIGGIEDGVRWRLSHSKAIASIEAGDYRFYVGERDAPVWVVVSVCREKKQKFLKTTVDDQLPRTLLLLPSHSR